MKEFTDDELRFGRISMLPKEIASSTLNKTAASNVGEVSDITMATANLSMDSPAMNTRAARRTSIASLRSNDENTRPPPVATSTVNGKEDKDKYGSPC